MNHSETTPSSYRYVVLGLLGSTYTIGILIVLCIGLLLPAITEDLDLSPTEQGWLGSSVFIGNLALTLPMSLWFSRFNARILTSVTVILGVGCVALQGWAQGFIMLLLWRVVFGIVMVAREPARALLITQWFPPREVMVANGFLQGMIYLADTLSFLLTPFILILLNDSWRGAFYIYAIAYAVVAAMWVIGAKEGKRMDRVEGDRSEEGVSIANVFKHKELWYGGLTLFSANILWGGLVTFWPTLMLDKYDIGLITSGLLQALAWFMTGCGGIAVAFYIVKRDVRKPLLLISPIVLVTSAIGLVLTDSLPALIALSIIHGLAWAFNPIIFTIPFELPHQNPREIALGSGFVLTSMFSGMAVGPIIVGFVQEVSGDLTLAMITSFLFAAFMIPTGMAMWLRRCQQQPQS